MMGLREGGGRKITRDGVKSDDEAKDDDDQDGGAKDDDDKCKRPDDDQDECHIFNPLVKSK